MKEGAREAQAMNRPGGKSSHLPIQDGPEMKKLGEMGDPPGGFGGRDIV
jgi:hypothetical protein